MQKAIQILKRHRDIIFQDDEEHLAPISIIITTISAQLYNNEDNIYDTLDSILSNAKQYINECKKNDEYLIENPSYTGTEKENFADKWKKYPQRAEAFFDWLIQAKSTLIDSVNIFDELSDFGRLLNVALGENIVNKSFLDIDASIAANIIEKTKDKPLEKYDDKSRSIITARHKLRPLWRLPKGISVIIRAKIKDADMNEYNYESDGVALNKIFTIDFTAYFQVKTPYILKWQIVNTGNQARLADGLRGGFDNSNSSTKKNTRHEVLEYTGTHSVQCFVIKGKRCVAKSDIFLVNII